MRAGLEMLFVVDSINYVSTLHQSEAKCINYVSTTKSPDCAQWTYSAFVDLITFQQQQVIYQHFIFLLLMFLHFASINKLLAS